MTACFIAAGGQDAYLIEVEAEGNELWSRTFGGTDRGAARPVQHTPDGGYIVAGFAGSFGAGWSDVYLIKTDANGNAPPPE